MITVKMSVEEFHMMIVALQNTASGCEHTAAVFEADCPEGSASREVAAWRAVETREMAFKYNQMADGFRKQAKEKGW